MVHLKRSIVEVKAVDNCWVHALVITIAKVDNDSNYESYCKIWKIRSVVRRLLETTGIDLSNGAVILEIVRFQKHFREYKKTVYQFPSCENVMFEGQVESSKRLNLLYDNVDIHYYVITNVTGTMTKQYVCKACNKECRREFTHVCVQTCRDAWLDHSAHSKVSESKATSATSTLTFRSVSIITSNRVGQRKYPYAAVSEFAPRVQYTWRAKISYVISDFVKTLTTT